MTHPLGKEEVRASSAKIPGRTRYQQFIHREAKRRFAGLPGFVSSVKRGRYGMASEILFDHFTSTGISWLDEQIASSWLKHNRPADPS